MYLDKCKIMSDSIFIFILIFVDYTDGIFEDFLRSNDYKPCKQKDYVSFPKDFSWFAEIYIENTEDTASW